MVSFDLCNHKPLTLSPNVLSRHCVNFSGHLNACLVCGEAAGRPSVKLLLFGLLHLLATSDIKE